MEKASNCVSYDRSVDTSLVKERSVKRHHFLHHNDITTNTATGEMDTPSIVRFTMGVEFMDPWNSYLGLEVKGTGVSYEGSYVSGDWLSLIRAITLTDRHGLEIERLERANLLNNVMLRAMFGDTYMQTIGITLGRDAVQTTNVGLVGGGTTTDIGISEFRKVLIPLPFLLGLFRSSNLLPPYLMDGCELRIDWESAATVLVQKLNTLDEPNKTVVPFDGPGAIVGQNLASTSLPAYTLRGLEIVTDNYLLDHQLEQLLRSEYHTLGLPLKFLSYTLAIATAGIPAAETNLSLPIKQSFSRAVKLVTRTHTLPPTTLNAADTHVIKGQIIYPTFDGQSWAQGTVYRMDLNGVQVPHFPVNDQAVAYWHWLMAFNKSRLYNDSGSTRQELGLKDAFGTTFCVSFNRNTYQQNQNALYAESARVVSGVRIDGTSPATLHVHLGAVTPSSIYGNASYFPTDIRTQLGASTRELLGWVEHERYLICQEDGNRLLV